MSFWSKPPPPPAPSADAAPSSPPAPSGPPGPPPAAADSNQQHHKDADAAPSPDVPSTRPTSSGQPQGSSTSTSPSTAASHSLPHAADSDASVPPQATSATPNGSHPTAAPSSSSASRSQSSRPLPSIPDHQHQRLIDDLNNSQPTDDHWPSQQQVLQQQQQQQQKQQSASSPLQLIRKPRPPRPLVKSRNRVLPSYEEELQADNSVVRESRPRRFLTRALHNVNYWYHYMMGHQNEEHPAGPLSTAVDRLTRTPYDIERVAIIGVHGWFPSRLIQRVVGEPTGTSSHFARKMAIACQHFFYDRYGINLPMGAMTIIPLEGEGKVEDRVELLYSQLIEPSKKWTDAVRNADLVLIAAHSQGTPVATMLVARLIERGILDPSRQKTGILAMAGISHGPYPQLKSSVIVKYVESDPARQLFDYNDPTSPTALAYYSAMHKVLDAGARFIAVGSWYDQAVPLYSATLHGINHPNIYRALYIDAADYQPDFLSHLVVFALKLRNAGLSDHGLVVHLSDVLAGNIYGFGTQGHYAIYEEENTYTVAVAWTMGSRRIWSQRPSDPLQVPVQRYGVTPTHHFAAPGADGRANASPRSQDIQPGSVTAAAYASSAPGYENKPAFHSILNDPPFQAPQRLNPYHLPWIMAKITSDPSISGHPKLSADLRAIERLFESWEVGSSRTLKDIKYRLEPLRAKL
ncbi:hypothetical protein BC831DRAFT_399503 [Entophlyctis helioformis]|nr:hypothetical protein BC831DRAFT_399503 [Entophlyctis helioformis]